MLRSKPTIEVIGAPQDLGQELRGVDMGPSAIRVAGLLDRLGRLGYEVIDAGDVPCRTVATATSEDDPTLHYADDVVHDCEQVAIAVEKAVGAGHFPLVLGGDHSIAIGTMAGLARVEPRHGLLWIDAHADYNTPETTPSGNIHGMPLAAILGEGEPRLVNVGGISPKALEENTALIGLRSVDYDEAARIRSSGLNYFTMRHIDERGLSDVMQEAIDIASHGVDRVHLSVDADVIDPRHAPGTGTPVIGGLTYRESHLMMEMLSDADIVTSAEFVEVNPVLDSENKTGRLIVEIITSLCGQSVVRSPAPRLK